MTAQKEGQKCAPFLKFHADKEEPELREKDALDVVESCVVTLVLCARPDLAHELIAEVSTWE